MKIYTIGRGEMNTIHVDNEYVSRQHALLKVYPSGKMEIMDKSSNGTAINGRRLKPNVYYPVRRRDVVTLAGQVQLDWSLIADPMKGFRIAGICVLAVVILAAAFFIAKPYLFKDKPISYGGGGGGDSQIETPAQPADSSKVAEEPVDVKATLKKMTEDEKRRKEAKKQREREKARKDSLKKAEQAKKDSLKQVKQPEPEPESVDLSL